MGRPVPPYVMGIDVGTQSLRARVFDLAGVPVAAAERPLTTAYRHLGLPRMRRTLDQWVVPEEVSDAPYPPTVPAGVPGRGRTPRAE